MAESEREDVQQISLPAGMELVVPPPATEEAEGPDAIAGAAPSRRATSPHADDGRHGRETGARGR